jgi:hypothetical protein
MSSATSQARRWSAAAPDESRRAGIGGMAVVAGALAYVLHIVVRSMLTAGVDPVTSAEAPLWVPVNALGAVGSALVMIGLPAVADRIAARVGRAGLTGLALIALSWIFFGPFLSLHGALVQPWLAAEAPRLLSDSSATPVGFVVAFALGLIAWLAGAVMLAIPLVKDRGEPRWIGYLLPASAFWFLVGSFVIAPDGPASNLALNLLSNLGPVLLLIALGSLGVRTWADARSG